MRLSIKDAVEYCNENEAVIHTPTKELYIKLLTYLDIAGYKLASGNRPITGIDYFSKYGDNICVEFVNSITHKICISSTDFYDYNIIELYDTNDDSSITREEAKDCLDKALTMYKDYLLSLLFPPNP